MGPRHLRHMSSVKLDKTLRRNFLGNIMKIYLSLIAILTLCGVQSMKNGHRADITEFPFVVSIQNRWFHLCSGTIIDKYHILTVAHAVVPHLAPSLLVVPGTSLVGWPYRTSLTVKNIYPHPYYQELTVISSGQCDLYWDNDIAILQLNEPLLSTSFIELVSLSTKNLESYLCFECQIISWNYPDETNLELVALMWDLVYMMKIHRCEQWGIQVLANQQCVMDFFETAFISTEDLGSPIICGGSMVGLIVKEARQGETASPATFLSTLNYAEFISDVIDGGELNVKPEEFPYMVSIWHNNEHACGGIIVNSDQVITAGQCIRSPRRTYPVRGFKIAAGSTVASLLDSSVQWFLVSHMQVHPFYKLNYDGNNASEWVEYDIGLITTSTPFVWSPTVQRLRFADADDFSSKQLCLVLHWTPIQISSSKGYRKLTKSTAVLVGHEQPLAQFGIFHIVAKELYSVNSPELTDIGNPIICRGHPLGMMVKIHSMNVQSQRPQIIFLPIRPYALEGFFDMQ